MPNSRREFDVHRKSDDKVVLSRIIVASAAQAIGYYVARVLDCRFKRQDFYAIPSPVVEHRWDNGCLACGYIDPQRDQSDCCPSCEYPK